MSCARGNAATGEIVVVALVAASGGLVPQWAEDSGRAGDYDHVAFDEDLKALVSVGVMVVMARRLT